MLKWLIPVLVIGAVLVGLPDVERSPDTAVPEAASAEAEAAEETRLQREGNGHFYTEAFVAGEPVLMLVDTGASTVALTVEDAERIGIDFDPDQSEPIGMGASGAVRGIRLTLPSVDVEGKEVAPVEGAVIEGLEVSLLGQSYLSRLESVSMTGDTMILR